MIQKVLIANRGEIALRIIRACRELGIKTVAVYSEADVQSLHVQLADEAICIGGPERRQLPARRPDHQRRRDRRRRRHPSRLRLSLRERPIRRAVRVLQDRVHRPEVEGDQDDGRQGRRQGHGRKKAGVPTVPGSDGPIETEAEALKIARKIGYPVIIKAAAGGGGRGMRIAHNDVSFAKEYHVARGEAEKAFGNGAVYIEKYIEKPRHIEFQILADHHGNVVHLCERDCSVQRRHQKLIEESPSPVPQRRPAQEDGQGRRQAPPRPPNTRTPAPSSSSSIEGKLSTSSR